MPKTEWAQQRICRDTLQSVIKHGSAIKCCKNSSKCSWISEEREIWCTYSLDITKVSVLLISNLGKYEQRVQFLCAVTCKSHAELQSCSVDRRNVLATANSVLPLRHNSLSADLKLCCARIQLHVCFLVLLRSLPSTTWPRAPPGPEVDGNLEVGEWVEPLETLPAALRQRLGCQQVPGSPSTPWPNQFDCSSFSFSTRQNLSRRDTRRRYIAIDSFGLRVGHLSTLPLIRQQVSKIPDSRGAPA